MMRCVWFSGMCSFSLDVFGFFVGTKLLQKIVAWSWMSLSTQRLRPRPSPRSSLYLKMRRLDVWCWPSTPDVHGLICLSSSAPRLTGRHRVFNSVSECSVYTSTSVIHLICNFQKKVEKVRVGVEPIATTESPILFRSCEHETPFSDPKEASKIGDYVIWSS